MVRPSTGSTTICGSSWRRFDRTETPRRRPGRLPSEGILSSMWGLAHRRQAGSAAVGSRTRARGRNGPPRSTTPSRLPPGTHADRPVRRRRHGRSMSIANAAARNAGTRMSFMVSPSARGRAIPRLNGESLLPSVAERFPTRDEGWGAKTGRAQDQPVQAPEARGVDEEIGPAPPFPHASGHRSTSTGQQSTLALTLLVVPSAEPQS